MKKERLSFRRLSFLPKKISSYERSIQIFTKGGYLSSVYPFNITGRLHTLEDFVTKSGSYNFNPPKLAPLTKKRSISFATAGSGTRGGA